MSPSALKQERRGAITWVWLARPEVHNAFGAELIAELTSAFHELAVVPRREGLGDAVEV